MLLCSTPVIELGMLISDAVCVAILLQRLAHAKEAKDASVEMAMMREFGAMTGIMNSMADRVGTACQVEAHPHAHAHPRRHDGLIPHNASSISARNLCRSEWKEQPLKPAS